MKYKVILFFIILVAFALRFWQLGVVPFGITHDELGYVYNAYSISQTGRNVFGELLPFLTWVNQGGWPFLPVPIYLSAPFFWLFGLSATTGRMLPALLGVLDVILLFILVRKLFNNISLALLSAVFLSISPWHLHFSRSAYDPNYSVFFYLLAITSFLYEITKKRFPIITSFCLLLAIFSYRATTLLLPPIFIVLLWYGIRQLKMSKKQIFGFSIGILFVFLSLFIVISLNGKKYIAETLPDQKKIQEDIDIQIREAKGPLIIRRIFLNKPMYMIGKWRENYLNAYSPQFLFLYTEGSGIYSIWSRGRIYFIDIIFIIVGVFYLFKVNKSSTSFFISLLLIGGLPGMIGGEPYSARNFFLSVIFPVFSAGGVLLFLTSPLLKQWRKPLLIIIVLAYMYAFSSYLFDYYERYAFYGAESWAKSLKDISQIVGENKERYSKVIVGTASFGDFMQYAFYTKLDPTFVQQVWRKNDNNKQAFSFKNVTFTNECFEDKNGNLSQFQYKTPVLYIVHNNCNKNVPANNIIRDYFGNPIWKIYIIEKK